MENYLLSSDENGEIIVWNMGESDPVSQKVKTIETPANKLNKDLLLNNIQLNQTKPNELLISNRYKSVFLINLET